MSPFIIEQSQDEDKLEQLQAMYDKIERASDTLMQCASWFAGQDKNDAHNLSSEQIQIIQSASIIIKNVIAQNKTALRADLTSIDIPDIYGPPLFEEESGIAPNRKEVVPEIATIYGPPDFLEAENWDEWK